MSEVNGTGTRWQAFVGHGLTVLALSLGGLSSFHALRAEVLQLRAVVNALAQTEAEHHGRAEAALREAGQRRDAALQQLRDDVKDLRAGLRELRADLKNLVPKKAARP